MSLPAYGFLCLSCGQIWGPDDAYVKHSDPATGEKCRDVTGSSSVPSLVGPVADRTYGPEGLIAELRWQANYDYGYHPLSPEAVEQWMVEGRARIAAALRTEKP